MGLVFALVLLGCADDGTACERISAPTESYGARASCEADRDTALESDAALRADHPTVIARCRRTTAAYTAAATTGAMS